MDKLKTRVKKWKGTDGLYHVRLEFKCLDLDWDDWTSLSRATKEEANEMLLEDMILLSTHYCKGTLIRYLLRQ